MITASSEVPEETHNGNRQKREDLRTSHEEADLIIPQQVLFAVEEGACCVKVISDDTDVFVLYGACTSCMINCTIMVQFPFLVLSSGFLFVPIFTLRKNLTNHFII